jgi:hypothetical protein
VLSEKGQTMVNDLPSYLQSDPTTQALLNAVGNELQLLEDYLLELREKLLPARSTGELLAYWEGFLGLPVNPDGVSVQQRINTVQAAVRRRNAGPGTGWKSLLDTVMATAAWKHTENADAVGAYEAYGIRFYDIDLDSTDYRVGIFDEMVRRITPAHLEVNAVTVAGDDSFRVGINEVGDTI